MPLFRRAVKIDDTMKINENETNDILYGALKMKQPRDGKGPRVNVDTVLLADFVRAAPSSRIIEMGCAHGAISLIIAKRRALLIPDRSLPPIDAFDIDEGLVALAQENAEMNDLADAVRPFAADLREIKKTMRAEQYDVVIMNPPYGKPGASRSGSNDTMARAMHGVACSLDDVVSAAKFLLKNRGRLFLVMRALRAAELISILEARNVRAKRLRAIHPKPDRAASSVLIEAVRDGGEGVTIEPPLYILGDDGNYTRELLDAYEIDKEGRR